MNRKLTDRIIYAAAGLLVFCGNLALATENELPASTNPQIQKMETEALDKLKKGKDDEHADSLYDLAKYCFDSRDYPRAEKYLKKSLEYEAHTNRPEQASKTHVALAILYAITARQQSAIEEYKSALQIASKANLKDFVSTIIDSLGTLAFKSGKYAEAETFYKQAYELGVRDKNVPAQMNSLINQASIFRVKKDNKSGLELLKKALEISEQGDQDRSLGLALLNLARVQHDIGNLQESVFAYKKAIEVFKQDLDPESEANACWGLGETLFEMHKIQDARDAYQLGYDALKEEPDSDMKLSVLIGLGSSEADLGHFDIAQKIHNQAHDLSTTLKNRSRELESILQLGNDLLLSGYPEAGLYRLLEGEKLLEGGSLGAANKGTYLMAIGRCYKALGQVESAEKYYTEALKLFQDISDNQSQALALNSLAVLALDNRNTSEFNRYYTQAKTIYADLDDKRDLAILDYNYAQYMITEGKFEEANKHYSAALASIEGTGDVGSEGKILRGLGLEELLSNHPQKAMPYYEKALQLADNSREVEAQWDAHLGLGKASKRLGLNDMALIHLTKAVDLVEQERGRLTRDSFKTHNLDLRNDCFLELVDLYIRLKRPYDALAIAEKGRARAFLDMLSSKKQGRKVESFSGPLSSRNTGGQSASGASLLAMAKPEAGSRGVSVIPRASEIYNSSAVSPVNAKAPDIDEIKTLVKNSKSTLVEYYILQDKIVVWVIDPDTTIHMLPAIPLTQQALSEKVSLAYESIIHQPKSAEEVEAVGKRRQQNLRELYEVFLKPVEPFLPKDENSLVTIVPHGPMFMIPFAALQAQDKKYFIEKHTISYMPAIGVMRATQKIEENMASQASKLLAFGNPITKAIEFLGTLPYSEKEVQNIATLFGDGNAVVKIGQDANKKTFEELAPKFTNVHLATHGLVDEEHPMQSSLVLAPTRGDDGLLSVKDILAMKELKAKLVVLSACQTGRGKITGDGVVGLSRAFIIAGTPSVLVSQWNVDDIITEFQMKAFYKGYLGSIGKSKALRQAQIDTIKFMEGADYGVGTAADASKPAAERVRANPRYWAAFQLIGESGI